MTQNNIFHTGSYTGNGGTQSISIGWQPALVLICSERSSGPSAGRAISFKTPDMAGDDFLECSADAIFTTVNGITLTSDGFSVGSDDVINRSTTVFHFLAVRDHPAIDTGTYTGNGTDPQSITTGRQPGAVFVWQTSGTEEAAFKPGSLSSNDSFTFVAGAATATDITLTSTGFDVEGGLNTNTETYIWFALYTIVGSDQHIETDTYQGIGTPNPLLTIGYQPRFVFIFDGNGEKFGFKTDTMSSGEHGRLNATDYTYETGTTGVVIESDGFRHGSYNVLTVPARDYFWIAGNH